MDEWQWPAFEVGVNVEQILIDNVVIKPGDRVRLRPRAGGDIIDLVLADRTAMIESLEQDYEGRIYLAVVVDDDPGRDLGVLRQPGHRFFFSPDEVAPVNEIDRKEQP